MSLISQSTLPNRGGDGVKMNKRKKGGEEESEKLRIENEREMKRLESFLFGSLNEQIGRAHV